MGHADIVKLLMIIKKNLGEKRTRTVVGWGDVITDQGPEGNMLSVLALPQYLQAMGAAWNQAALEMF